MLAHLTNNSPYYTGIFVQLKSHTNPSPQNSMMRRWNAPKPRLSTASSIENSLVSSTVTKVLSDLESIAASLFRAMSVAAMFVVYGGALTVALDHSATVCSCIQCYRPIKVSQTISTSEKLERREYVSETKPGYENSPGLSGPAWYLLGKDGNCSL